MLKRVLAIVGLVCGVIAVLVTKQLLNLDPVQFAGLGVIAVAVAVLL